MVLREPQIVGSGMNRHVGAQSERTFAVQLGLLRNPTWVPQRSLLRAPINPLWDNRNIYGNIHPKIKIEELNSKTNQNQTKTIPKG